MPEGHTIHRKVVDQAPLLVGRELRVSSPNRRFEAGAARLDGRRLEDMQAFGKHLFYWFGGRRVLHVHLGMDGRFRHYRQAADRVAPARRSVWLRVSAPELTFDLSAPKVCEVIDEVRQRAIVAHLGPDPLRGAAGDEAWPAAAAYPRSIGEALLDQSVLAGVGNVYRAEVLFACRMHPERPAASITHPEWEAVWATAARMLRDGVRDGDIVTVDPRDFKVRDRRLTYVYGQRQCAHCGGRIRTWDIAGRVVYACEHCQPPWPGGAGV